ncbi:hypothetical protein M8494_34055 (plasmid) [Serratia ureilytica]
MGPLTVVSSTRWRANGAAAGAHPQRWRVNGPLPVLITLAGKRAVDGGYRTRWRESGPLQVLILNAGG